MSEIIGLDLETTGISAQRDKIAVVAIHDAITDETFVEHFPGGWDGRGYLREKIESAGLVIGHNLVGFDLHFLDQVGIRPRNIWDTMVAEQTLIVTNRADVRKNLAATMKRRLGQNFKQEIDHETWRNPVLSAQQLNYVRQDIIHLANIWQKQRQHGEKMGLLGAAEWEQTLVPVVADMMIRGFPVDEQEVLDFLDKERTKVAGYAMEFEQMFTSQFNPNSPKQIKKILEIIQVKVRNTKKETLATLVTPLDKPGEETFGNKILKVRQFRKKEGMYSPEFFDKYVINGRIHATFWQLGTGTTRFSSSDPNMQQVPRTMRHCFGNEPGMSVIASDYAQLELRVLAQLAQDRMLMHACDASDIHTFMATGMWGVSEEEVTRKQRQDGKPGSFTWGFIGGPGAIRRKGLEEGVDIPLYQCAKMLRGLRRTFPDVTKWQNEIKQASNGRVQEVILPRGHRRVLVGEENRPQVGANTRVQGTAAIGIKEAMLECEKAGIAHFLSGIIHDELVATGVPDKDAPEVARIMEECMIRGMQKILPDVTIKVDSEIGPNWAKAA